MDASFADAIAASRAALLDEIGPAPDLTFIRGEGNIGDELIWAGTREFLSGHVYREIRLDELGHASGEVALLTGSGAWCRAFDHFMPYALPVAELRFDRVIVLPTSFDASHDVVRETLRGTRATVFAREDESYRQIAGLCRARLAHDMAFFLDFPQSAGEGTLNAFRTDPEASGTIELPRTTTTSPRRASRSRSSSR